MITVSVTKTKSRLSELLDKVEAGAEVVITRRGRPIARLSTVARPKQPLRSFAAFRAEMPRLRTSSAVVLRELRDEGL